MWILQLAIRQNLTLNMKNIVRNIWKEDILDEKQEAMEEGSYIIAE